MARVVAFFTVSVVLTIGLLFLAVAVGGSKSPEPEGDRITAACQREYGSDGSTAVSACIMRQDAAYLDRQAADKERRVRGF